MTPQSVPFDRAAGYYDETRGFPPAETAAIGALIARAGALSATSRVLEIGVGTGRIALPLAPYVGSISGIDLARPMLDRLRDKQQNEPVHVVEGDIHYLPYASRQFDAAVSVHIFHLVEGWRDVLREVARVLRPGGVLMNGFRKGHHDHPVEQALWGAWTSAIDQRAESVGISREQYDTFLTDEGWTPVEAPHLHTYYITITPRAFIGELERRVWSGTWHMSDEMLASGLAEVHAAVRDLGIALDDPIDVPSSFSVQAFRPPAY